VELFWQVAHELWQAMQAPAPSMVNPCPQTQLLLEKLAVGLQVMQPLLVPLLARQVRQEKWQVEQTPVGPMVVPAGQVQTLVPKVAELSQVRHWFEFGPVQERQLVWQGNAVAKGIHVLADVANA
jgi:hypothetical protein